MSSYFEQLRTDLLHLSAPGTKISALHAYPDLQSAMENTRPTAMISADKLTNLTFLTKVGTVAALSLAMNHTLPEPIDEQNSNDTYYCCPQAEELIIDSLPETTRFRETKSIILTYQDEPIALRKMGGEKSTYALRTVRELGIMAGVLYATSGIPKPNALPRINNPGWMLECTPDEMQFHFLRASIFLVPVEERRALFDTSKYTSIFTAASAAKTLTTHQSIVAAVDTALSHSRPVPSGL